MTGDHVTTMLLTCLLLIGASCGASVRSVGIDAYKEIFTLRMNVQEEFRQPHQPQHNSTSLTQAQNRQCQKVACPPNKILEDTETYRKVYFPEAVYAKIQVEGKTMLPAVFEAYDSLSKYYNGANAENKQLPMTAPVILRVDPGQPDGMFNPRNFTLFFYMDPSVKSPPAPKQEDISVLLVNSYTLWIRTFSSYTVSYADWMREELELAGSLDADKQTYKKNFFYFATYNSPFEITNRINEVQFLEPHENEGDDPFLGL